MRFKDFNVAITGAASGLGRDIAKRIHQEGAARIVLLDVDEDALSALAQEIGRTACPIVCDVSNPAAVARAWQAAALNDGLDVLVTAAGTIGSGADIEHCPPEEWDRIFAINVRGTYLTVQAALPRLRQRKGNIVTLGSIAGLVGSLALGPYSASKGAITTLTRSLALAHAHEGLRANCVCPASIDTPMLQATFDAAGDAVAAQARRERYLARYPMGRFGRPEEVSEAVLFLASPGASYMTGVCLPVDGGLLA